MFGCCCFPYLRPFVKHKLKLRSQPSTFLGYSAHHKGYFCLTPDGKVIVSRHVVFDENRFLFPLSSSTSGQTSLGTTTYVLIVRPFTTKEPRLPPAPTTGISLASHNEGIDSHDSSTTRSASHHSSVNSLDDSGTVVREEAREEALSTEVIPAEHVPVPILSFQYSCYGYSV